MFDADQAGVELADVLAGLDTTRIVDTPRGERLLGTLNGAPEQYMLPSIVGMSREQVLASVAKVKATAGRVRPGPRPPAD
jgi:hypothetical protein